MKYLSRGLKYNQTICELYLNYNIYPKSMKYLSSAIKYNTSLKYFECVINNNTSMKYLIESLEFNKSIMAHNKYCNEIICPNLKNYLINLSNKNGMT